MTPTISVRDANIRIGTAVWNAQKALLNLEDADALTFENRRKAALFLKRAAYQLKKLDEYKIVDLPHQRG